MDYKLVVAVREDLDMSKGKMAVQVAHAAVISAMNCKRKNAKWFRNWYDEGQKKVVVRTEDVAGLHELSEEAEKLGISTATIDDAGLTELPPGTTTCLGIGPAPNSIIDQVTGKLKLW
ncbi:MAG: peptidyl-tRNA hydrolase [Methanomassiliicoccales archaeon]|nr:MAG: peptidyl-tRNA hydrolase [Methanomassiliicoccales archaeon]